MTTGFFHSGAPADPPSGSSYPLVLRPTTGVTVMFGILAALAGYVVLVPTLSQLVLRVGALVRGAEWEAYSQVAGAYELPDGLLAGSLGLASLTVVALLVARFVHGRAPRWTFSVQPGMRWRLLFATFLVALVVLNGMLWLSFLWQGWPTFHSGQLYAAGFVAVVLIATPLQAMAEEVFFRGYLMQAIGSGTGRAWLGILGSALVFAVMHGSQNAPLFAHRFLFGIVVGWLVYRTGGLEAAIAAHVVNNLGAYGYAIFTSSVAEARGISEITWAKAGWDILTFALFSVVAVWIADRMRAARTTP